MNFEPRTTLWPRGIKLLGFTNIQCAPKPPVPSTCEAYRDLIEQALDRGRNGKAIWQDLVSEHGFTGGYQTVKRFVQKLRRPGCPEPAGIILTAPGEEGQVDYGSGPMVCDAQSGKYRRTRLFVLTLGYSRKSVRLLAATPTSLSGSFQLAVALRVDLGCVWVALSSALLPAL